MPVQMFVGGVEIQIRLSGSAAFADGPYSFNSRFALVRTLSPGAIACAGPVICQVSLKNNGGGAAAPRPWANNEAPAVSRHANRAIRRNMPGIIRTHVKGHTDPFRGHRPASGRDFPKEFYRNRVGRNHASRKDTRRKIMRRALISSAVFAFLLAIGVAAKADAQVSFGVQIG